MRRIVTVPFWVWNLFWILALLGADSIWEVIGAILALIYPHLDGGSYEVNR